MKARFTDEQIIAIIKEQEAGEKTAGLRGRTSYTRFVQQSRGACEKRECEYNGLPGRNKVLRSGIEQVRNNRGSMWGWEQPAEWALPHWLPRV